MKNTIARLAVRISLMHVAAALAVLMRPAAVHCAMAPNGGPWAPALIDMDSAQVTPRLLSPRQPVKISFNTRPSQAHRITHIALQIRPEIYEAGNVTDALDREAGRFEYTIPAGALKPEGTYSVRVPIDFKWDDGKVYHRSPPFGEIEIRAYANWEYTAEGFEDDYAKARAAIQQGERFLKDQDRMPDLQPLIAEMQGWLESAQRQYDAGDHPAARSSVQSCLHRAEALPERVEQLAYQLNVRRYLQEAPQHAKPTITIMPGRGEITDEDIAVMQDMKVTCVLSRSAEDAKRLKDAGFETVWATPPARMSASWAKDHPDHRQQRYLVSDPVKADGRELAIDPIAPFGTSQYELDTDHSPHQYWRVYDVTDDVALPIDNWRFDPENRVVRIQPAQPGHEYTIAFLVYCRAIHFFGTFADPIHDACHQGIMRRVRYHLGQWSPTLDVYRPTSWYYPFPSIRRETGRGQWNWWAHQWGAGPHAQRLFEKETGIEFNPDWITDGRRYGHINYPPRQEYLRWMEWQRQNVTNWAKQVVEVAHEHGIRVRPFWGDHWMGMEPHLDFFDKTDTDEIVKACNSAICARMTTDIPADIKKIIRFSPWINWGELFRFDHPAGRLDAKWTDIKRAILFRVPDGLSWGGETNTVALRDPQLRDKLGEITREYRVIYDLLWDSTAFTNDLTVYVVNAWGQLRPWPGWGQINPSQDILVHLTHLPIRVKFISCKRIASEGVPRDASVLLNCGEPGSAWSGGYFWKDQRLVEAIRQFVESGGGFIGIGAPSHCPDDDRHWQLADLLGLDYAGATSEAARQRLFTPNDAIRAGTTGRASFSKPMQPTAEDHWITRDLPAETQPLRVNVKVEPKREDVTLLASGDGEGFAVPIVAVRSHGAGRVAYISGYSTKPDYRRLLERTIFWAANQQQAMYRAYAADPAILTYLYPDQRLLVLYNPTVENRETVVRADISLVHLPAPLHYQLWDVLADEGLGPFAGTALRSGVAIRVPGRTIRFLRFPQVTAPGKPEKQ